MRWLLVHRLMRAHSDDTTRVELAALDAPRLLLEMLSRALLVSSCATCWLSLALNGDRTTVVPAPGVRASQR
jgi:hypothetical protein